MALPTEALPRWPSPIPALLPSLLLCGQKANRLCLTEVTTTEGMLVKNPSFQSHPFCCCDSAHIQLIHNWHAKDFSAGSK